MKSKALALLMAAALSTTLFVGCGSTEEPKTDEKPGTEQSEKPEAEKEAGFTGVKTVESKSDENDVTKVDVTFENGTPVDVKIDIITKDGKSKVAESEAGNYVMKEGEENAWHKQIALLETFIKENNFDLSKVTLTDDEGHTDAVSGVTIKVPEFVNMVKEAMDQAANGEASSEEAGFTGTKTKEVASDKDVIKTDMEFKDGKPVSVKIDIITEDGKSKVAESEAGNYVMKEGEENAWHKQIALLETFLVENNFDISKVTLTDEEGHTDAVAGVTIKVPDLLKGVDELVKENK